MWGNIRFVRNRIKAGLAGPSALRSAGGGGRGQKGRDGSEYRRGRWRPRRPVIGVSSVSGTRAVRTTAGLYPLPSPSRSLRGSFLLGRGSKPPLLTRFHPSVTRIKNNNMPINGKLRCQRHSSCCPGASFWGNRFSDVSGRIERYEVYRELRVYI